MKRKVLVIGLDCATFKLIRPYAEENQLPALRELMAGGVSRTLKSTVPPISPPAWSTFLTGQNPARHGIFHFFDLDVRDYSFTANRLVNSSFFAGHTFIDCISNQGRKVGIVKIPFTYPPWSVNGFMVAGDPSPDWRKAHTFPPELSDEIGRVNLGSSLDFERYNAEQLFEHLSYDCRVRTEITRTMLRREPYDFFMVVHNITDAAAHRYWKFTDRTCPNYEEGFGKYQHIIRDVYRAADRSIAEILKSIDRDTTVFIMSDHGAARKPLHLFHMNAWLREAGYLRCREGRSYAHHLNQALRGIKYMLPPTLRHLVAGTVRMFFLKNVARLQTGAAQIDMTGTKAYAVSLHTNCDGIAVNLKGRQPQGVVEPGRQADELLSGIAAQLGELKDPRTQRKMVRRVCRREEVFSGPFTERMPDLIILYDGDYRGGKGTAAPLITEVPPADFDFQSGDHDEDGIFIAAGPSLQKGRDLPAAHIQDMAPTILYAMGLPVPDDMDGRVLLDIFDPEFVRAHPVVRSGAKGDGPSKHVELNADETNDMKRQLQGLGYL